MRFKDCFKGTKSGAVLLTSDKVSLVDLDKLIKKSSKTNMRKWREQFYKSEPFPTSPLNLCREFSQTLCLPPLEWHNMENAPYSSKIINSGHTTVVKSSWYESKKKPYLTGGPLLDQKYIFYHTHFHWGESEHSVEGTIFPMEVHSVFFHEKYKNYETALKETEGILIVAQFCRLIPDSPELKSQRTFRIQELFNRNLRTTLHPDDDKKFHPIRSQHKGFEGKDELCKSNNIIEATRTKDAQFRQTLMETPNAFLEEIARNIRFVRSINTSKLIHTHSMDQLMPKFSGDFFFYLSGIKKHETMHRVTWIVNDKNHLLISKAQLKSFEILRNGQKHYKRTTHDSYSCSNMFYIVNHAEDGASMIKNNYSDGASREMKSENSKYQNNPKMPEESLGVNGLNFKRTESESHDIETVVIDTAKILEQSTLDVSSMKEKTSSKYPYEHTTVCNDDFHDLKERNKKKMKRITLMQSNILKTNPAQTSIIKKVLNRVSEKGKNEKLSQSKVNVQQMDERKTPPLQLTIKENWREQNKTQNIPVKNEDETVAKDFSNVPEVLRNNSNITKKEELQRVLQVDVQTALQNHLVTSRKKELKEVAFEHPLKMNGDKCQKITPRMYSDAWTRRKMLPGLKKTFEIDRFANSTSNIITVNACNTNEHFFNANKKPNLVKKCENTSYKSTLNSISTNVTSPVESIVLSNFRHDQFHEMCETLFNDVLKSINFTIEIPCCSKTELPLECSSTIPSELPSKEFSSEQSYSVKPDLKSVPSSGLVFPSSFKLSLSCPFNRMLNILLSPDKSLTPRSQFTELKPRTIKKLTNIYSLSQSKEKMSNLKKNFKIRKLLSSEPSNIPILENKNDALKSISHIVDSEDAQNCSDASDDDDNGEEEIKSEKSSARCYIDSSIFEPISVPTFSIDSESKINYSIECLEDKKFPRDDNRVDSKPLLESKIPRPQNVHFEKKSMDVFVTKQSALPVKSRTLSKIRAPKSAPTATTTKPIGNVNRTRPYSFAPRPYTTANIKGKTNDRVENTTIRSTSPSNNRSWRPPKYKKLALRKRVINNELENYILDLEHPDKAVEETCGVKINSVDASRKEKATAKIKRVQAFAKKYKLKPKTKNEEEEK